MKQIIEETNRTLRGWMNYFQTQHLRTSSRHWTNGCVGDCAPSYASVTRERGALADGIISAGQMPTSPNSG